MLPCTRVAPACWRSSLSTQQWSSCMMLACSYSHVQAHVRAVATCLVNSPGCLDVAAGFEDKTAYAQCIFVYTPGELSL